MKRMLTAALSALATAGMLTACSYEPFEGTIVDKDKSTYTSTSRSGSVRVPRTRTSHDLLVRDANGTERAWRVSRNQYRECEVGDHVVRTESGEVTCTG